MYKKLNVGGLETRMHVKHSILGVLGHAFAEKEKKLVDSESLLTTESKAQHKCLFLRCCYAGLKIFVTTIVLFMACVTSIWNHYYYYTYHHFL